MYKKLDPYFKTAWIHNLRSGRLIQGKGSLAQYKYDQNNGKFISFCCLGVACITKGLKEESLIESGFIYDENRDITTLLPDTFPRQLVGGGEDNPLVKKLAAMNDGNEDQKKLNFDEIADWIEENL